MLLDEELTESMRHAAPQQPRGGNRHRDGTAVVDEMMTFEADEPCMDFPTLDAAIDAASLALPNPRERSGERRGSVMMAAMGNPGDDLGGFGVSTENIGLLVFSSLQNMADRLSQQDAAAAASANPMAARLQQQQQQHLRERESRRSRMMMSAAGFDANPPASANANVNVQVNPSMTGFQVKQGLSSRELIQRSDLSSSKFERSRPLEPCAFLEPGVTFGGTQDVSPSSHCSLAATGAGRESWDLKILVEETNFAKGYVCGTMHANGFNCSSSGGSGCEDERVPVVTFWEGELIDNVNHSFYTQKWGASKAIDRKHWFKLPFCKHLQALADGGNGKGGGEGRQQPIDLVNQPFIYMRLKEKYFLNEEPGGNLTIAGFYYLCISRATGEITGYYFDPNSTPYQKVKLAVIYEGSSGFVSAAGDLL